MHRKYHTKSFVLSSINTGEANKYLSLWTRELGLIRASAQGLRTLHSRLRYSLQDFSCAHVDLVRGRDIWRVTSARKIEDLLLPTGDNLKDINIGKILKLISRLCPGEDPNPELWDEIYEGLNLISEKNLSAHQTKNFEIISVMKILYHLGYWEGGEELSLIKSPYSIEILDSEKNVNTRSLIEKINSSLKATHL